MVLFVGCGIVIDVHQFLINSGIAANPLLRNSALEKRDLK